MNRSLTRAPAGWALALLALFFSLVIVALAPPAQAAVCGGSQGRVNFSTDRAAVRYTSGSCGVVAVRHQYFPGGSPVWSTPVIVGNPVIGTSYQSAPLAELSVGNACTDTGSSCTLNPSKTYTSTTWTTLP